MGGVNIVSLLVNLYQAGGVFLYKSYVWLMGLSFTFYFVVGIEQCSFRLY